MTTTDQPSLFRAMLPMILVALALVVIRAMLEYQQVDFGRYIGVYYGMPVALLVWGKLVPWTRGWKPLAKGVALLGILVFVPCNIASYTAANYGLLEGMRYAEDRMMTAGAAAEMFGSDPAEPSNLHRIIGGVATGALTGLINTLWCLVFASLFVWRPKFQPIKRR